MNVGSPSDGEKDQVKLNQQTSGPPSGNPPRAWPPKDQPTPGNAPSQAPPPAPPPAQTPSPSPPAVAPPSTTPETPDIGVGKPNIGVELEDQKAAPQPSPDKLEEKPTISVSTSEVKIPPPPASVPPPATPTEPRPSPPAEKAPEASKIEVQTSDIPIKTYDQTKTTEQPTPTSVPPAMPVNPQPMPSTPVPPVKSSTSPTTTIAVLAILALISGAGGGFFGFRSWDKLKTSASVENLPEATLTATATSQESPSANGNLQTYTSTLYNFSLKYPQNWEVSTTEPTAETIVFASDRESLSGDPSGYRIEINFQDANGMTLKNWVEANAVATNETKAATEITVDGQSAFQQELTKIRPAVATYIERPGKIMIVTFTAPSNLMSEGGDWYNDLINSIKLT